MPPMLLIITSGLVPLVPASGPQFQTDERSNQHEH